ncbi:MAG: hypothetical protein LBQ83_03625 [Candidatus Margulisbacteria bacterium]|jgi:hypothetical protein|nr:hypothetical protein [Candidatus Margulisiibacteriota bacterium]
MICLKYIPAVVLGYLWQTVWPGVWFRPELVLIIFCLFFSGRAYAAVLAGGLTGLALDVVNGYSFYNTFLYLLAGAACGFLPPVVFRGFRSLALVGLLLSSLLLNCGYPLLTRLFAGRFIYAPLLPYLSTLLVNAALLWLLHFIPGRRHD